MTLNQSIDLVDSPLYWRRLQMALLHAASGVILELASVPEHAARLTWATRVLSGDGVSERRLGNFLAVHDDAPTILATDESLIAFVEGAVTVLAKLPA